MFYDGGNYMGGMHGLWWIFWLLIIGAVVYTGWGRPDEQHRRARETPLQVLQRRLASGELSTDEYEKRKALLDRDASPSA
jgi:putative membrane protein